MSRPLVSVGIPTYNRPDGLKRTLNLITQQTCHDLEIIVSDNASTKPEVTSIVENFSKIDARIRYIHQKQNIGAYKNFQFVLRQASGEFFMWAADDDEWSPRFIEACLNNIGSAGSAMSGWRLLYRDSGQVVPVSRVNPMLLNQHSTVFSNATNYLANMQSTLFYGVHRRATILPMLREHTWDWYDCYFVLRQILEHNFACFEDDLFTYGIDGAEYVIKPAHPRKDRFLEYLPFFINACDAIQNAKRLSEGERAALLAQLYSKVVEMFEYERSKFSAEVYENRFDKFKVDLRRVAFAMKYLPVSLAKRLF